VKTLLDDLVRLVADARAHGMTVIDLATMERLLAEPRPGERRDLMQVYPLVD
jgi:hypothetical protein